MEQNNSSSPSQDEGSEVRAISGADDNKPKLNGFGELFRESFIIYRSRFWQYIKIMLVPIIGGFSIFFGISAILIVAWLFHGQKTEGIALIATLIVVFLPIIALIVYLSLLSQAGMYLTIVRHEERLGLIETLKRSRRYVWPFFITGIWLAVLIMLWSMLFIIPGIIFAVYYGFAFWLVMDSSSFGREAIKKSRELVKGYWWAVAGRIGLLYLIFFAIFYVITQSAKLAGQNYAVQLFSTAIAQALQFVAGPLFVVFSRKIYENLMKVKGEVV